MGHIWYGVVLRVIKLPQIPHLENSFQKSDSGMPIAGNISNLCNREKDVVLRSNGLKTGASCVLIMLANRNDREIIEICTFYRVNAEATHS